MPTVTKVVRFYEPIRVDQQGVASAYPPGYWRTLRRSVPHTPARRRNNHNGMLFAGDAAVGKAPALPYLRIGRLRARAEWPEIWTDSGGAQGPLTGGSDETRLFEVVYLVPFGANNNVAVMAPQASTTSLSAMEAWLTAMSGQVTTGYTTELRPLVDASATQKLEAAVGIRRLHLRTVPGFRPTAGDLQQGGQVARALGAALAGGGEEMQVEMTIGFGHQQASADGQAELLRGTRWLRRRGGASKLQVTMLLPDEDTGGLKSEMHDLIRDNIAVNTRFSVPEEVTPSEGVILTALSDAIAMFEGKA